MAVGTVTLQQINPFGTGAAMPIAGLGPFRVVVAQVQVTSGANYTVGGSVITAAQLGLQKVLWGEAQVITQVATVGPSDAAVLPQADGSIKLKAQLAAGSGENAGNADLSGTLVQIVCFGY